MARLLLGNHISVSLDSVRKQFGFAPKLTPYNLFKGKHWKELPELVRQQVAAGACDEVESIWKIFGLLSKNFPIEEFEVIDTTIRMFTEPVLRADVDLLAKVWEDEERAKAGRLAELALTAEDLQSSQRFADLLRAEGEEPQTKDGKNGPIYAFAKTDEYMRGLLEHDDDRIRLLAEARLGEKSTLMQTRAETLGWMASRGSCPVYLRYAGAHTTRWSGGDGANWQNFKRGSDIRRAIMAPQGYLLAPIDLSQIECRILNYLAGQEDVIDKFRNGEDPYVGIASQAYGFPVTKAHVKERGTGKQLELSCGYQAGAKTIQNTARLGIYGPPVVIDLDTATRWRDLYRSTHEAVVEYWKTAGRLIARLAGGPEYQWGPMLIRDRRIYGPGGTFLIYDTLEYHKPGEAERETLPAFKWDGFWRYRTRNGWTDLYSGKLVENVVQWLARIVMSQAMIRLTRRGYRVVNTTHDELLILLLQDGQEARHVQECEAEMTREVPWLPGLPLACESSLSERYAK
jgi:DNA polymerase